MRLFLTCWLALLLTSQVHAQYQKMVKANTLNFSGSPSYGEIGWSKQLTGRTSFVASGIYFRDETTIINSDNFTGNLAFTRWLIRISDFYVSAGFGGFLAHTRAKSAANTEDSDVSFGIQGFAELEFYPTWWLVLYGQVRQMEFFSSDYFDRKFIPGGGIKLVF